MGVEIMPYESAFLNRIFLDPAACAAAERHDQLVVTFILQGYTVEWAKDLAQRTVQFDWDPDQQRRYQIDSTDEQYDHDNEGRSR